MKQLGIVLKNCHGTRALEKELDFRSNKSVAIYAPNGTMKTSFARTFNDLATRVDSRDNVFPDRTSERHIVGETGDPISPDYVVVFFSYDEEFESSESTSTLLVNSGLRKEYEALKVDVLEARDELIATLKSQAKTKQDVLALSRSLSQTNRTVSLTPWIVRMKSCSRKRLRRSPKFPMTSSSTRTSFPSS